jgi:hypothetical protein
MHVVSIQCLGMRGNWAPEMEPFRMGSEEVEEIMNGKWSGNHKPWKVNFLDALKLINGDQALNSPLQHTEEAKRQAKKRFEYQDK